MSTAGLWVTDPEARRWAAIGLTILATFIIGKWIKEEM